MAQEKQTTIRWQQGRGLNITASPAFLSLLGVIVLCVLGWCFYLGFMVGRGQNPEKHLQEMAAILSPAEKPAQTGQPQGGTAPAEGEAGQNAAQPAEAGDGAQQPGQPDQAGQAGQNGASPVPGFPAFQQGTQGAGQNAGQAAQAADQKKPEARAAEKPKAPYTFSYRMATVRTREDARKEQERYEKKGFRTSIRQSGKAWSLFYTLKGTDSDADQFVRDVKKAGLSQPVRVSKKAN
ncbi:MAG: hypothetical protein Q3990_02355 [Desulfovibrionaceae bacterium]|nr:hypothetical protein [Desulfovibrionaceae bacterium]